MLMWNIFHGCFTHVQQLYLHYLLHSADLHFSVIRVSRIRGLQFNSLPRWMQHNTSTDPRSAASATVAVLQNYSYSTVHWRTAVSWPPADSSRSSSAKNSTWVTWLLWPRHVWWCVWREKKKTAVRLFRKHLADFGRNAEVAVRWVIKKYFFGAGGQSLMKHPPSALYNRFIRHPQLTFMNTKSLQSRHTREHTPQSYKPSRWQDPLPYFSRQKSWPESSMNFHSSLTAHT